MRLKSEFRAEWDAAAPPHTYPAPSLYVHGQSVIVGLGDSRGLTPTRRTLFSQTVEILVLSLRAHSATARVLGALALRAMDSDGVFGSRNV